MRSFAGRGGPRAMLSNSTMRPDILRDHCSCLTLGRNLPNIPGGRPSIISNTTEPQTTQEPKTSAVVSERHAIKFRQGPCVAQGFPFMICWGRPRSRLELPTLSNDPSELGGLRRVLTRRRRGFAAVRQTSGGLQGLGQEFALTLTPPFGRV